MRTALVPVAYGIRNTRVIRPAFERIVASFALGRADRMDRRKINHVEAHRFRIIKPLQTITKGRATITATLGRAWKKFIPRGEERRFALDHDAPIRTELAADRTIGIFGHDGRHIGTRCDLHSTRTIGFAEFAGRRAKDRGVGFRRAGSSLLKQMHPFQGLRMQILLSPVKFPPEFVPPSPVGIEPSFDRVFAIADLGDGERTGPHIIVARSHRDLLPLLCSHHAPLERRRNHIVPILEDVGRDLHRISD